MKLYKVQLTGKKELKKETFTKKGKKEQIC